MIFWLGLFAGLIIGWVIEWVIDWRFWRSEQPPDVDEESRLRRELESARLEINHLQAQLAPPSATEVAAADQFQDITGIGQVFAKRLNDAGIYTFAQLSELSSERLHEIIQPQEWQSLDYAAWISQARALAQKSQKGG